jgi:hypothetical protein
MSQLVKTKRQANFKGFRRFRAFKGLVEQKNVVFNSFVCKLGLFWYSWAFKSFTRVLKWSTRAKKGPIYTQTPNKLLLLHASVNSVSTTVRVFIAFFTHGAQD